MFISCCADKFCVKDASIYSVEENRKASLIDMEAVEGVWLESKLVTTGQEVWAADVLFDPVYSFTMWSIYRTAQPLTCSPHPSNITWLSSVSLTGGTLCLSTHSFLNHTHIHTLHFLRFQTLIFSGLTCHMPPYLLVSKLRSPELNLSQAQAFFSRVSSAEGQRTASVIQPATDWQLHTGVRKLT